jgi:hypothetical protein
MRSSVWLGRTNVCHEVDFPSNPNDRLILGVPFLSDALYLKHPMLASKQMPEAITQ